MCGVLTGSQITENVFRISNASPPCVKCNSRFSCKRDASLANLFIEEDYNTSDHTRVYIGEWHTHPQQNPMPSEVDCNSIIFNYNSATLAIPILFMLIIGNDSIHISVYDGMTFHIVKPIII